MLLFKTEDTDDTTFPPRLLYIPSILAWFFVCVFYIYLSEILSYGRNPTISFLEKILKNLFTHMYVYLCMSVSCECGYL